MESTLSELTTRMNCLNVKSEDEKEKKEEKTPYYIGAHVSGAGGIYSAIENASKLGATAFALSRSQWAMKPIEDDVVIKFKEYMIKYGYKAEYILPHGSYICNIGSADDILYEKARNAMLEECKRVELLGLKYLNIHPGSTAKKCTKIESIKRIADAINVIQNNTKYMTIVLENTAGGGGTVGVDFTELKGIIDLVQNKERIGVCIDTCHAFASGINIKAPCGIKNMIKDFDDTIGLKYLKAMHLNDSTGALSSNRDNHKPLGQGEIGWEAFRQIMNCDDLRGIPLILETPAGSDEYGLDHMWAREIRSLYELIGKDPVEEPKKGIAKLFAQSGEKNVEKKKPLKEKKEKEVIEKASKGKKCAFKK